MPLVDAEITHADVSGRPSSGDGLLDGPAWDRKHKIDPVLLAAKMSIQIVSDNPNDVLTGPGLAIDIVHNQLWINIGGKVWTSFVRSDGGQTPFLISQIFILGDSNAVGFTPVVGSNPLPDQSNPGFAPLVAQPTTFVYYDGKMDPATDNPPVYTEVTGGVVAWPLSGDHDFGIEITLGKDLTAAGLHCVLAKQAVVGMSCAQMVPSPSPPYPTSGPSWFSTLVSFAQALESARGSQTQIVVIFAGNNDGLDNGLTAAIAANNTLLTAGLVSNFPHLKAIIWVQIHSDTVNFSGFLPAAITNQVNWFAANPTISGVPVIPVIWDALRLRDHAHGTCNTYMTLGQWIAKLIRGILGLSLTRPSIFPALVGYGPVDGAQGTTQPDGWGGADVGFLEVLIDVQLVGSGTAGSRTDPSGWTLMTTGVVATATPGFQMRISVYKRAVDSTMLSGNHGHPAPTSVVMDNPFTDHYSQILSFWGPNVSPPTVDFAQVSGLNNSGTSYSLVGGTTSGANRTIVVVNAGFPSPQNDVTVTLGASNVTGMTQVKHGIHSDTAFFVIVDVQVGQLASLGPTGNIPVTLGGNCIVPGGVVIAIAP
jgi:hypothetical protein